MILPADFIHIADLDGKPAAFIVLIPNVNEAIADLDGSLFPFAWARLLWRLKVRLPETGRIALMGVRREFHHTRMGPTLAFSVMQALHGPIISRGLYRVEASWILEQNQGMRNIMEQVGGVVTKRYRVYQKSLL